VRPALWIFVPLLLAYATALGWCWDLWWLDDSYFAHQPLVPLVMVAVIWLRRAQWQRRPAACDARGWWLLLPGLLLHLCGAALTIDSLSAMSLVLTVPGAAWLALGRERLRGLWPVLWMCALAVPLPIYTTSRLAFELKENAVRGGLWLAQTTGLQVVREGAFLHVPLQDTPLNVADPCGGLRSLLAMVTLVYCIAFFVGPPSTWRRTLLLVAAAPVALFVNVLRIAAICWAAHWQGVPFATGTGHDVLNALAWIVDLAIVIGIDTLTSRGRARRGPLPEPAPDAPVGGPWRWHGAWLWAAAAPLLFLSLYRPSGETSGRAASLPRQLGTFVQQREFTMPERYYQLLGTRDATWRSYADGQDGQTVFVVAVFHGSNWKSVHPPHVCLEASDIELLEDSDVALAAADGERAGRILGRSRTDGRPYLTLYVYGARDLCTGSYGEFFLHHAPRALFRRSNDGFLLRVDTYADGDGGVVAAEQRCRALLAALLREAKGLLP
jgi:exosortase